MVLLENAIIIPELETLHTDRKTLVERITTNRSDRLSYRQMRDMDSTDTIKPFDFLPDQPLDRRERRAQR
jgi:hypothetical protein